MLDPETTLDTVGKASEAVTKFQEIMLKVFGPRWTKKQADADAYADERKLQTIRDNPDMEIVYTQDGMIARARTPEALAYRAERRMLNDAIRQEANIEQVVELATTEIERVTDYNNDPVDDDWITRFFSIVKDVNSAEMQHVWGKILAGEIAKPGMFSMRTLETIRNISKNEAEVFQKMVPFFINWGSSLFVSYEDTINEKYGIYFGEVLLLDECGLMEVNSVTFNPVMKKGDLRNLYTDNRIAIISGTADIPTKISFSAYKLTTAGKELLSILDYKPNNEYFEDFCEHVFQKNKGNVTINIHQVLSKTQEGVRYDGVVLKAF